MLQSHVFTFELKGHLAFRLIEALVMYLFAAESAASSNVDTWPLVILLVSVAWVVVGITKLRLHPFLTLMLAAVLVGWMTPWLPEATDVNKGLYQARVALAEAFEFKENNETKELETYYRGELLSREETSEKLKELSERHKSNLTLSFRSSGTKEFNATSVQAVLREAEDLNRLRQIRRDLAKRAEEAAAKTTIKLVFPLVLFVFPALFVVILGPAVIQVVRALLEVG